MSSTTTGIEWTDATWNPIRGCSRVSPGCENCYAERVAARFSGDGMPYEGLARIGKNGPRWTGKVRLIQDVLEEPLRWKKPRRVFVNSMSDLFHENLTDTEIGKMFGVMAVARRHTFQVLTKRPNRMQSWFSPRAPIIPNVWLGVSVEDQQRADERIPLLLATPAAVRFVSYEPALGPVDLRPYLYGDVTPHLDWVIVGGESGPGARPFDVAWARDVVAQCRAAGVACFTKQIGSAPTARSEADLSDSVWRALDITEGQVFFPVSWRPRDRKGGNMAEWPEDIRVREFPEAPTRASWAAYEREVAE